MLNLDRASINLIHGVFYGIMIANKFVSFGLVIVSALIFAALPIEHTKVSDNAIFVSALATLFIDWVIFHLFFFELMKEDNKKLKLRIVVLELSEKSNFDSSEEDSDHSEEELEEDSDHSEEELEEDSDHSEEELEEDSDHSEEELEEDSDHSEEDDNIYSSVLTSLLENQVNHQSKSYLALLGESDSDEDQYLDTESDEDQDQDPDTELEPVIPQLIDDQEKSWERFQNLY